MLCQKSARPQNPKPLPSLRVVGGFKIDPKPSHNALALLQAQQYEDLALACREGL